MKIKQQKVFKTVPHKFNGKMTKPCPWVYCTGCGLVLLNNDATRKRANKPCQSMED